MADDAAVEAAQRLLLGIIDTDGSAETSGVAQKLGWDHLRVVGMMKSLESFGLITAEVLCDNVQGLSESSDCSLLSARYELPENRGSLQCHAQSSTECMHVVPTLARLLSTATGRSRRRGGDTWRTELQRRQCSARYPLRESRSQP